MASSGMLLRVALVRTEVLEELSSSIIRVTRIDELGTLAVTSNRRMLSCLLLPSYDSTDYALNTLKRLLITEVQCISADRLCGLVVRVPGC
jgi:hypothetical protein